MKGSRPLDLLTRTQPSRALMALFDHLPDVCVFIKDARLRFTACNQSFLGLLGAKDEESALGKQDSDFFPRSLWENYLRDDQHVLETGTSVVDRIELIRNSTGALDWFSTTKVALRDRNNFIIGVFGFTRDLQKMTATKAQFQSLSPALETIVSDYAKPISIARLASAMSLSVSQFERQFKKKFETTPRKYILRLRLDAASQLLSGTGLSMADIAERMGFFDQSHFTHQFVKYKGMTPTRYRAHARRSATTSRPC